MSLRRRRIFALSIALLSACGGGEQGTGPTPATKPLTITGADVSDTVGARLPLALTIEVRVNGAVRSGVIVRMDAVPSTNPNRPFDSTIQLAALSSNSYGAFLADSTDANGRVRALVRLGSIAGKAQIVVSVPEIGAVDTARFTVRPGVAAQMRVGVRDTAVRVGGTYSMGGAVTDRYGNPRSETLSFQIGPNATSVDASGLVTAGTTVGTGFVVARFGALADTGRFTVVPNASIVGILAGPDQRLYVSTVDLDGSNRKWLVTPNTSAVYPSSTRSGGLTVYHEEGNGEGATIFIVDSTGARRRLLGATPMFGAMHARFSNDGQFVYFHGRAAQSAPILIWRVRPDGTGLEQLTMPTGGAFTQHTQVSPSPDGSKIVYQEDGVIVVRTLSTGATVRFTTGWLPTFSPDGRMIAFLDGSMAVVADATGGARAQLTQPYLDTSAGLAWTNDGQWLISRTYMGVTMVSPATRQVLVLPVNLGLYQVSVRP